MFTFIFLVTTASGCLNRVHLQELVTHVEYLAADGRGGRMTGTSGLAEAEEYIFTQLDGFSRHTKPVFQEFELFYPAVTGLESGAGRESSGLGHISRGTRRFPLLFDTAHYPLPGAGAGTAADKDIVFAGYGITAPEYAYDDYKDLEVGGKIVLVFRYEPNADDPDSLFMGTRHTRYAAFASKIETAAKNGAEGLVLVDGPLSVSADDPASPPFGFSPVPGARFLDGPIPAVHVSLAYMEKVFPEVSFHDYQLALNEGRLPSQLKPLPAAEGSITLKASDSPIKARNILLFVPSRQNRSTLPEGEKRVIVVGAHHDHLGSYRTLAAIGGDGGDDYVLNGADDNASGTAAVLELAGKFAGGLRNTGLVFAFFSAEELGLFGSKSFVEEYRQYVEKAAVMLNFDMIGRDTGVPLLIQYSGQGVFTDAVRELAGSGVTIKRYTGHGAAVSDFLPFHEAGIPTVFFFTGLHDEYHHVDDEADRLSGERMQTVTEMGARLILNLDQIPGDSS